MIEDTEISKTVITRNNVEYEIRVSYGGLFLGELNDERLQKAQELSRCGFWFWFSVSGNGDGAERRNVGIRLTHTSHTVADGQGVSFDAAFDDALRNLNEFTGKFITEKTEKA